MRIISFLATLPILWAVIFPQTSLAAGPALTTNETQTKFKIQDNSQVIEEILDGNHIPYNYPGYKPVKNPKLKKIVINASAYTASADECGKSDGITASGTKVQENKTLACPPQYKFGTLVQIDGYGTYICEDRGGAIKGNRFDIYMRTKNQAFTFGRQHLLATIIQ